MSVKPVPFSLDLLEDEKWAQSQTILNQYNSDLFFLPDNKAFH